MSWAVVVSNHGRRKPTDLQSVPFNHSGNDPFCQAKDRNRTYDRLITNQLLYQLSYFGASRLSSLEELKRGKFNKIYLVLSTRIAFFLEKK